MEKHTDTDRASTGDSEITYTEQDRDEYNGLLTHQKRQHAPLTISRLTAFLIGLVTFLLFTLCIYLMLLLHNFPTQVQSIIREHNYQGPISIQHDATLGPYIECQNVTHPEKPPGCSFDLLANGWVPNPCFDAEMDEYYVKGANYEFWEDYNGTIPVSQDTIINGDIKDRNTWETGVWLSDREHWQHCSYLINGTVSAHAKGWKGRLDHWVEHEHMMHCLKMVMEDRTGKDEQFVDIHVKAVFVNRRCYLS